MPAAAPKPEPHAIVELVSLDKITESPHNHRTRTWGDLDGLAQSIKEKGVLQPVLLRPLKGIGSNLFELVFGARRVRASKAAGLKAVPAMIREMTDVEVIEAQIIENVNRADVHPMEEAEGYSQLLQPAGPYTVDELAAKVGKSKGYIYARMKLLALCPEARKAFYEEEFSASVMLLVARIASPALQKQALQELKPAPWNKSPRSLREATEIIHENFMLRLADAPFERGDASLVKSAGACTTCPKRSGAQPELFADVDKKAGDLCTDPPCFQKKKEAWQAQRLTAAEEAGQEVLGGAEAKKAIGRYSGDSNATHVKLDSPCYEDPKRRTYAQLLGKKAPVTLASVEGGDLVELVEKKAARDLLREAGHKFAAAATATKSSASSDPTARRERLKQEQKRLAVRTAIGLIVAKAEATPFDDAAVDQLAGMILDLSWHDTSVEMANRRGIERGKGERPEEALEKRRKKMTPAELRGLMVEALVTRGAYFAYSTDVGAGLKKAAAFYGVDLKKCADDARAFIQAREDAKKSKGKGKAKVAPPAKGKKTVSKAAARELPRASAKDLEAELCLDCGVAAGKPSPGCEECAHPAGTKGKAGKPTVLKWRTITDGVSEHYDCELAEGAYEILPGAKPKFAWDAYWIPKGGASVALGSHTALSQAKDACLRHLGGAT